MSISVSMPSIITPAGNTEDTYKGLLDGKCFIKKYSGYIKDSEIPLGRIDFDIPSFNDLPSYLRLEEYNSRTNYLLLVLFASRTDEVEALKAKYGSDRVGIVVASTNPGMEENFEAVKSYLENGDFSKYSSNRNALANPANFLANLLKVDGPSCTVSNACTSGIKAIMQSSRLIEAGVCDAVICAGSDSLNRLTINGFNSLQILTDTISNPFSKNRNGVNLGEAAGYFILSKDEMSNVELKAYSSNTDSYHITKPCPTPDNATNLLKSAYDKLKLTFGTDRIDYINLHATGTVANDFAEAKAIAASLGRDIPSSGIKQLLGHCLGAAGIIETAICIYLSSLESTPLPPHIYDGEYDESLDKIRLVNNELERVDIACSLNFAFGGDNACIIVGKR